jgi:hypothetical protein
MKLGSLMMACRVVLASENGTVESRMRAKNKSKSGTARDPNEFRYSLSARNQVVVAASLSPVSLGAPFFDIATGGTPTPEQMCATAGPESPEAREEQEEAPGRKLRWGNSACTAAIDSGVNSGLIHTAPWRNTLARKSLVMVEGLMRGEVMVGTVYEKVPKMASRSVPKEVVASESSSIGERPTLSESQDGSSDPGSNVARSGAVAHPDAEP